MIESYAKDAKYLCLGNWPKIKIKTADCNLSYAVELSDYHCIAENPVSNGSRYSDYSHYQQ